MLAGVMLYSGVLGDADIQSQRSASRVVAS